MFRLRREGSRKRLFLLFISVVLVGAGLKGEFLEFIGNMNGREDPGQCFYKSCDNVKSVVPKGTYAKVTSCVPQESGNYGIEIEVINLPENPEYSHSLNKGDRVYVYYDKKKPWLKFTNEQFQITDEACKAAHAKAEKDGDGVINPYHLGQEDHHAKQEAEDSSYEEAGEQEEVRCEKNLPGNLAGVAEAVDEVNQSFKENWYCKEELKTARYDSNQCQRVPQRKHKGKWRDCFKGSQHPNLGPYNMRSEKYKDFIKDQVKKYAEETNGLKDKNGKKLEGIDPTILMAMMRKESHFVPYMKGPHKEHGIGQMTEDRAKKVLKKMRKAGFSNLPKKVTTRALPGCKPKTWGQYSCKGCSLQIPQACLDSIENNCTKPEFSGSLYCPQFAIRLMAHYSMELKYNDGGKAGDGETIREKLLKDGGRAAEARFIVSQYNRGSLIFNSAKLYYAKNKRWPTADNYGELWDAPKEGYFPYADKLFSKGHIPDSMRYLKYEWANRCHIAAVTGLCGGMQGSFMEGMRAELCSVGGQRLASH